MRGKYRDVIFPMMVIRRLDAVLADTKQAAKLRGISSWSGGAALCPGTNPGDGESGKTWLLLPDAKNLDPRFCKNEVEK